MARKKSVLIIAMSGLLCAYGILGLYRNSFAQPLTGKCGDGICDDFERTRSNLCPQDCAPEKSTESSSIQESVAAPIGKCGDTICDNFEKANPGACPADCASENTEKISPIIANVTVDYAKELGRFSPYVFGAIASPYFNSKGYELSKDAGFKIIGINAPSVPQDPNDPKQYDFSEIDQAVKAAIDNGLEPLIIFFTDNKKPSNLDDYGIYAQNVAKHLTQGWNNGYNYEIKVFRFGNEPDNFGFWQDTQENWFAMYVAWAKALKSVNKNFILDGLALMSPRVGSDGGLPSFDDTDKVSDWITNFLAYVKKNNAYVDLVSIHAYAPLPYFGFYDNYRLLNNELEKHPNLSNIYGTPRAANDEWNLLLGDFWSGFYGKQFDTAWAASGRVNSLISMIEQGVWLSIPMFGTFNDTREGKGEGGCHDFLLVDCNAQGKPSYYAFQGFNQLSGTNRVETTGTDHMNLAAIAGKKNNEVVIVISNHDIRKYMEKYEGGIQDGKSPAPEKSSPAWFEYNAYVAKYGKPKVYNNYTLTLNNLPWSSSDQVTYERYIVDDNKKLELTETKTMLGDSTLTFTKDISAPSVEVVKVYVK